MVKHRSTHSTNSFAKTNVEELTERCREEEAARTKVSRLISSCFELFRRAVRENCQESWNAVYNQYRHQMIRWAGGSSDDAEDLVHCALENFFKAMIKYPQVFTGFAGMASVMAYLKRCTRSVLVDGLRKAEREQRIVDALRKTNPTQTSPLEHAVLDPIVRKQCVEHIHSRLNDDKERLMLYLQLELELKPAEVVRRYPDQFPNAREVYKIRDRIIHRLSQDPVLQDLGQDYLEKHS